MMTVWVRRISSLVLVTCSLASCTASPYERVENATELEFYELPETIDSFIEGIAYDELSDSLYVAEFATGRLAQVDMGQGVSTIVIDDGLPRVGLAVDQERRLLWAAGGAESPVHISSLDGFGLVASALPISGSFINDVVVDVDGTAYLTDSTRGTVLEAKLEDGEVVISELLLPEQLEKIPPAAENASLNGLAFDGESLLTVHTETGRLFRIALGVETRGVVAEVDVQGGIAGRDGILFRDGFIYGVDLAHFSGHGWGLNIASISEQSASVVLRIEDDRIKEPATMTFAGQKICVSEAQFGSLFPRKPYRVACLQKPAP